MKFSDNFTLCIPWVQNILHSELQDFRPASTVAVALYEDDSLMYPSVGFLDSGNSNSAPNFHAQSISKLHKILLSLRDPDNSQIGRDLMPALIFSVAYPQCWLGQLIVLARLAVPFNGDCLEKQMYLINLISNKIDETLTLGVSESLENRLGRPSVRRIRGTLLCPVWNAINLSIPPKISTTPH